jgi:hypothetical protein
VLEYLRYFRVFLVSVFAVYTTLFVAASEPVRRIPVDNNAYPRFRYVIPAAMQESLPIDETNLTTPQNLQNLNSDQLSPQVPRTLPSTEIAQPTVPATPAIPTTTITPTSPVSEPAIPEPVINNPFQYKFPDGNVGVPRNISSLPSGIQVIGILMLKNQKSIAAIRLPKTNNQRTSETYYVHEGDVIEVPSNLLPNRRTSSSRGTDDTEILFLVVETITPQHVEVRSRSNIADKHIIR